MSRQTRHHWLATSNRRGASRNLRTRSPLRRALRFEPLEDRRLLAVVTVDTLDDSVNLGDGHTSLREAIFATNTVPGADTINFSPALTAGSPAKILLTQGELAITDALTINGPGANLLTIDAQQTSRIFDITATVGDFSITGLSLTNGHTVGGDVSYSGGAIRSMSAGQLTVAECTILHNHIEGERADGGGIRTNVFFRSSAARSVTTAPRA